MAEEFTLPSGETVKLRGLTGYEVMLMRKLDQTDEMKQAIFMVSAAIGGNEDDAIAWMNGHIAGDFMALLNEISRVSGIDQDAAKSSV